MYAVIRTGGKQYRVTSGDVIAVEKLAGEAGGTINFADVLLISDGKAQTVGAPTVDGATVAGTILEQGLGDKIIVFKKKRRKGYRRTKGHRQPETVVRIMEVLPKGQKPAAKKAASKTSATEKADIEARTAAKPKAAAAPKKAEEKAPPAAKAKSEGAAETTGTKTAAAKPRAAAKKPTTKTTAPKAKSKE